MNPQNCPVPARKDLLDPQGICFVSGKASACKGRSSRKKMARQTNIFSTASKRTENKHTTDGTQPILLSVVCLFPPQRWAAVKSLSQDFTARSCHEERVLKLSATGAICRCRCPAVWPCNVPPRANVDHGLRRHGVVRTQLYVVPANSREHMFLSWLCGRCQCKVAAHLDCERLSLLHDANRLVRRVVRDRGCAVEHVRDPMSTVRLHHAQPAETLTPCMRGPGNHAYAARTLSN